MVVRQRWVRKVSRGWTLALVTASILGMAGGWLPATRMARAATLVTVTSTADTVGAAGSGCTLRDALTVIGSGGSASGDCPATSGADAVAFNLSGEGAGPWTITLGSTVTYGGPGFTLQGPGADQLTIRRVTTNTNMFRLFTLYASSAVTISGVTLTGGDAGVASGGGGAINTTAALTVANAIITANSAFLGGGGIATSGALTVTNSTISGNLTGGNGYNGGGVNAVGPVTITGSIIANNSATAGNGGGFFVTGNATVTNSTFRGNSTATFGGGFETEGVATVTASTFSGNSARFGGGFTASSGATVTNSTFSSNDNGSAHPFGNGGGGIYSGTPLTVTNSTFKGNNAAAGSDGGAIATRGNGSPNTQTLTNTVIVAGTIGNNCALDSAASFVDRGGNFQFNASNASDTSCGATAPFLNPLLGDLADNGGPTQTIAPQVGSPALDASVTASCPATDQRGVARPTGAPCDSGALQVPATTTSLTVSPNPAAFGQAITLTATVSSIATPTGTVTFKDGTTTLGTASLTSGSATLTTNTLAVATHAIAASYGGAALFKQSDSAAQNVTVNQATTTTTITAASPNPAVPGQQVTISFAVSPVAPGAGTPTGDVTISDGTLSCTATVAVGQCSRNFPEGTRTLTASYAGDTNFAGSASQGYALDVSKATTTTTITNAQPEPANVGQAVTVSYSVSASDAGTPTGNVTVGDGTTSCTGAVSAGQCALTFASSGVRTLTATYAGDSAYLGSTSAGYALTVNAVSPSPSPTPSPTPSQSPAATYTVMASVAGDGSLTPNGTTNYAAGATATYSATPAAGQVFTGWTLDGRYAGYASPLTLTVDRSHTLVATFVARPVFSDLSTNDPDYQAITTLAALGIVNPQGVNGSGRFELDRPVARAEMAAFVARVFGWQNESHANPFPDRCDAKNQDCIDNELWQAVAALADYDVVGGYTDTPTCASAGTSAPCYLPRDPVLRLQVVSIVTRAFTTTAQHPDAPWSRVAALDGQYQNVPVSGTQRSDLATYRQNAGPIPGQSGDSSFPNPTSSATRRFVIEVLWQAYSTVYGVDRVP